MDRLASIWGDLVYAGRSLAKARAFTLVCVISLGIGMAPVLAVPYAARVFTTPPSGLNTDGLVEVVTTSVGPRRETGYWSYPDYIELRDADTGVAMTAWVEGKIAVSVHPPDAKTTTAALFVSSNYFETMGVALERGAGFQATADPVVVLGHRFWQTRLNADPDVLGRTVLLDGVAHVVVGVVPRGFEGHLPSHDAGLFVPFERHPRLVASDRLRFDRTTEWVRIHGRLAPGVGIQQASAAVSALTTQLAKQFPATNEFKTGIVAAYHPIGAIEGRAAGIMFAVGQTMMLMPLLVVCLNIAGMMMVRGAMRERELSIRQAMGATRERLLQHLLAEAVLLAAVGGTLASLVLFNAPPLISWIDGEPMTVHMEEALRVDLRIVAVSVGVCLLTSVVFGWLPAARFSRPAINSVLKDEAGAGGVRVGRVHRVTAALQVALAVPLLVISGVALDRVRVTATADLGFDSDLLYAAPLKLNAVTGDDAAIDSLARASGVASVTVADGLPLDSRHRTARVSLAPLTTDANAAPRVLFAHVTRVGDGYLDTLGIRLVRGRTLTADDRAGGELVTVISKTLADQLFGDAKAGDAIGQRLTFAARGDQTRPPRTLTIVGVSADFPTSQLGTDRPQLLLPLAQHADVRRDSVRVNDDADGMPAVMLIARSAPGEPPVKMRAALENAIREVNPDFDPRSTVSGLWLRESVTAGFLNQSVFTGISGGVILMLSALGIYGVVGLMVSTRTREIAVRMTLGASRLRVLGMIVFDVVKLVAPGVAVGLIAAAGLVRLDGGIMGTPFSNLAPLAFVAGATIAILIAVLASLPPARRAASVQPMEALRST